MAFDSSAQKVWPYVALFLCVGYGALPFVAPRLAMKALTTGLVKTAYVIGALPSAIVPLLLIFNFLLLGLAILKYQF
jgi:hypothetical protein